MKTSLLPIMFRNVAALYLITLLCVGYIPSISKNTQAYTNISVEQIA